jgi:predicted dehydrogenase
MIRLGLIGCGGMARSFVDRLAALGERVRVTATVDVDLSRAQAAAEALGNGPVVADDYRQVLDDIDAALLVLPHHLHHPVTMACLEAGKHVLVEKPMANSEQECLEMIAAAERANRVLMVAYVMRYHPLVLKFKELIDSGEFGTCFHLSLWTEQLTQYHEGHWALSAKTLGGGQLFSHGCHYVDLLLWMLGRPVEGCHMGTNFGTPWMEMEGTSDMAIKFESGSVGYHMGTWGARGTRHGYNFQAHCTQGMLECEFRAGRILFHQFKNRQGLVEPHIEGLKKEDGRFGTEITVFETGTGKQTDKEVAHFLDCIQTGCRPQTDGRRSLQSLRVIWRMYEAERTGVIADLRGLGLDEC